MKLPIVRPLIIKSRTSSSASASLVGTKITVGSSEIELESLTVRVATTNPPFVPLRIYVDYYYRDGQSDAAVIALGRGFVGPGAKNKFIIKGPILLPGHGYFYCVVKHHPTLPHWHIQTLVYRVVGS